MRPCTTELSRYKSSLARQNTPYGTNTRKTNKPVLINKVKGKAIPVTGREGP
jgi:hypothetical protein